MTKLHPRRQHELRHYICTGSSYGKPGLHRLSDVNTFQLKAWYWEANNKALHQLMQGVLRKKQVVPTPRPDWMTDEDILKEQLRRANELRR